MGAFKIGNKFDSIEEYCNYPYDNGTYATKPYVSKAKFVAKSADEAEKKMIKYRFGYDSFGYYANHEYEFSDRSGIVKIRVVECND